MNKIVSILILLLTGAAIAIAQPSATRLMGLGVPAPQAAEFAAEYDSLVLDDTTAASSCVGSVTATGTTAVTVSTTCINTGDYVLLTQTSAHSGTNIGCWATNIVDGTSFDFDCAAAETATFNWFIVKGQ